MQVKSILGLKPAWMREWHVCGRCKAKAWRPAKRGTWGNLHAQHLAAAILLADGGDFLEAYEPHTCDQCHGPRFREVTVPGQERKQYEPYQVCA
jgi:hypothetical protein